MNSVGCCIKSYCSVAKIKIPAFVCMKVTLKAFMPQGQEERPKGKHVGDYFANYCTSPHTAVP